MFQVSQGKLDGTKGVWERAQGEKGPTALMSCPKCGKICSLSGHDILPDGRVNPSVVCPRAKCTFHAWIRLKGWKS